MDLLQDLVDVGGVRFDSLLLLLGGDGLSGLLGRGSLLAGLLGWSLGHFGKLLVEMNSIWVCERIETSWEESRFASFGCCASCVLFAKAFRVGSYRDILEGRAALVERRTGTNSTQNPIILYRQSTDQTSEKIRARRVRGFKNSGAVSLFPSERLFLSRKQRGFAFFV